MAINTKKGKKVNNVVTIRHPYQLTANFIKWKFTPGENRVLLKILQRIKHNQVMNVESQLNIQDSVTLRFHWRDLMLDNVNDTKKLREDLKLLRSKSVAIPYTKTIKGVTSEHERITGLISEADFDFGKSHVELFLNSRWYAFLIDISKGFTEYNSLVAYNLSTTYSIKMYYFINHWFDTGGKTMSIAKIRKEFNIPDEKYANDTASAFKKRILDPTKKALDETADRSFSYSDVKQGRSIVGFKLAFHNTKNHNPTVIDWKDVNNFLDILERHFKMDTIQRARLSGLVKKYSFQMIKHFYNQQRHVVEDNVNAGMTVVDAFSKALNDYHIEPITAENGN
jgi:plasmid replication initiation protein